MNVINNHASLRVYYAANLWMQPSHTKEAANQDPSTTLSMGFMDLRISCMLVPKSDRLGTTKLSSYVGVHYLANYLDDQASPCCVGGSEKEHRFRLRWGIS